MNVRELQQHLTKLDPNLPVLCYTEDANLLGKGMGFRVFEIDGVSVSEAERCRLTDRTPYLKLGKGPASRALAVLEITGDV
jgi:hypothetical protein